LVFGLALTGPPLGGDGEGLLSGFLGELEVAEEADQGGEDSSPLVAEDLREGPGLARTGAMVSLVEDR
jgi:hypothetical protein